MSEQHKLGSDPESNNIEKDRDLQDDSRQGGAGGGNGNTSKGPHQTKGDPSMLGDEMRQEPGSGIKAGETLINLETESPKNHAMEQAFSYDVTNGCQGDMILNTNNTSINLNSGPATQSQQTRGITFNQNEFSDAPIYGPSANSPKFVKVRQTASRNTMEALKNATMENKNYDPRNYIDVFNRDVKLRNYKLNLKSKKDAGSFRNLAGKMSVGATQNIQVNSARTNSSYGVINNPEQAKAKAGKSFKEKFNMYGYKKGQAMAIAKVQKPDKSPNRFAQRAGSVPRATFTPKMKISRDIQIKTIESSTPMNKTFSAQLSPKTQIIKRRRQSAAPGGNSTQQFHFSSQRDTNQSQTVFSNGHVQTSRLPPQLVGGDVLGNWNKQVGVKSTNVCFATAHYPGRGESTSPGKLSKHQSLRDIEVTPGCTDYSPEKDKTTVPSCKQQPVFAVQNAPRFKHQPYIGNKWESKENGPIHSYQKDTTNQAFALTNTGSFFRASRFEFKPQETNRSNGNGASIKSKSPRLNSGNRSLGSGGRGRSPDLMSSDNGLTFTRQEGARSTAQLNTIQQSQRPSTGNGTMRLQLRKTSQPTMQTLNDGGLEMKTKADRLMSAKPTGTFNSRKNSRTIMPRALSTVDQRAQTLTNDPTMAGMLSLQNGHQYYGTQSGALTTTNSAYTGPAQHRFMKAYHKELEAVIPGPSCYNTIIQSCLQSPHKQTRMTRERRFKQSRPDLSPDAPIYDTRNAVQLLRKQTGGGTIYRAARNIKMHKFDANHVKEIAKGIHIQ